jgi:hypothetical protein
MHPFSRAARLRLAFYDLENPMQQTLSPAELISRVGTALFGSNFQHDMAAALGVNRRTVGRWVAATIEPRAGVWSDLLRLIEARHVELGELGQIIAARVEPGER